MIELEHPNKATPKNEEIKKEISNFLKIPEELIFIRHIYTNYGTPTSKIIIHAYKTKEDLNSIEFKKKKPRKKKEKKQTLQTK